MSKLSASAQKESTQKPVSGKGVKGSSDSVQNQIATIEKESCETKKVSFSDIVSECVDKAYNETPKNGITAAFRNYEIELKTNFIANIKDRMTLLLIVLRKERNAHVAFLKQTNKPINYDYRRLPSYKFVKALRVRLDKGAKETDNFDFAWSSTSSGLVKSYRDVIRFEEDRIALQYRFTNSLLHLKESEKQEKLAQLRAICDKWIQIGITKEQAVTMNETLKDSTIASYIEYLDLLNETETETTETETAE